MSGFTPGTKSAFHFGACPPEQASLRTRRSVRSFPAPTAEVGSGLTALPTPEVWGARAVWLKQIDRLLALPGSDRATLLEVRS